jgi:hypothetical protein
MSLIDSVSPANYIPSSVADSKQLARQLRNRRKEEQLLESREFEGVEENATETAGSRQAQNFGNELSNIARQYLQGNNLSGSAPEFSQQMLNEFVARYAEEVDVKSLLKFFGEDKLTNSRLDDLCNEMEANENGENVLVKFFQTHNFSHGEIYIVLSYLLEYFKLKKSKYKDLVAHLLEQLEEQESAYLFEFFQLTKANLGQLNFGNMDAIAKSAAGTINSGSLIDIIGFINNAFSGDYSELVSNCIKYRLKFLKDAELKIMNFEDKAKLGDYLLFEKHLIVINSTYLKLKYMMEKVRDNKVTKPDNYSNMLTATINFAQANFISDLTFNNMLRGISIAPDSINHSIVLKIIMLFRGLPLEIFNADDKQQSKVIEGLRQQATKYGKDVNSSPFSFIKSTKKSIVFRG